MKPIELVSPGSIAAYYFKAYAAIVNHPPAIFAILPLEHRLAAWHDTGILSA
jgi:hypothetical protein